MTDAGPPEVIVIGDSHAMALKMGCDALGIPAAVLSVSGNFWHMGRVAFDGTSGIRMRGNRRLAADAEAIRTQLGGGPLLRRDLPVIVSAGFNLGRLVPRLIAHGHVAAQDEFDADPDALHLSGAFLRGYVAHHREPQLRILRRIARAAPVTVVPPPLRHKAQITRSVFEIICEMMRGARLDLYDPMPDLVAPGEVLDDSFYLSDKIHGNARYGQAVIERLVQRGALARKAA